MTTNMICKGVQYKELSYLKHLNSIRNKTAENAKKKVEGLLDSYRDKKGCIQEQKVKDISKALSFYDRKPFLGVFEAGKENEYESSEVDEAIKRVTALDRLQLRIENSTLFDVVIQDVRNMFNNKNDNIHITSR
jgi:hypothetical protein